MDSLTSLLSEDASWSMPPFALWLQTHADIRKWCLGPGIACRGSRLVPAFANGSPAFGQYKPGPGGLEAWSMQVLELEGDRITGISSSGFSTAGTAPGCRRSSCGRERVRTAAAGRGTSASTKGTAGRPESRARHRTPPRLIFTCLDRPGASKLIA